ncbi:hypothetical protein GSI_14419 [Ganoderma sinense ZZ0214-1]|uniref:Enolase C-terminal domain-containing protein n=1 Tax=Ganoderma sinense ZZ0214-1 TaxID=1077348 RepID=A0A2G8RNN7_9APHY|nr:hypothetical protein GSI_14419 [Ganoderma sinense ZZ0214-1]
MATAQMHYNQGADLLTYLVDPSVFNVHNGYVEALQGSQCFLSLSIEIQLLTTVASGPGLGIEVDEALVREAASKHASEKAWRNVVWTGPDGALQEW